jgi:phosphopentomutase
MDSFGIGWAPDAQHYGDEGANTFRHIAEACDAGRADREGLRAGPLRIPNLMRLGLGEAARCAMGDAPLPVDEPPLISGLHGCAAELSSGKDTPSGHWEIAGVPVTAEWGYFPCTEPCVPEALTDALLKRCQLPGFLGNKHASGTDIMAELGEAHVASGKPIIYSSADSVLQIAAHEEHFGLQRLYDLCSVARELVDTYNIGRVIARPFVGDSAADFRRTANRKDLATPPPIPTLLDRLVADGGRVTAVGKIADIFAHRGISRAIKGDGNAELFERTLEALDQAADRELVFSNFVDFDTLYGHRRDTSGYAACLEAFDALLPRLEERLSPGDLAIITADHGCDPTWPGTDHTREHIPILAFGPAVSVGSVGRRESFADIGQSVASHLQLSPLPHGKSFI